MTDNLKKSLVKTIIDEGVNSTTTSNWIYYFDQFEHKYGVKPTPELIDELVEALREADEILDVEKDDECINIIFSGELCPNLEE